jgi:putative addiction module component (TIGR02574 family)
MQQSVVTLAEIEQQARMLSAHERAQLVEILLKSLHEAPLSEIDAARRHEIEERVAAYDRGEIQTYAAEDVFAEARRMSR